LTARLSALATRWGGRCTGSTRILKDPCCYPLLAHLAQTGQILQLKNRPARCTTLRGAEAFLREVLDGLHARFGRSEFRMDVAFFQDNLLRLLTRRGCFYAIPTTSQVQLRP
jgi:hypothetical protein